MTFSKQIYPTLHVGPLLIRHLITDGKNGEKKKGKSRRIQNFLFFGENFCDSSFPKRQKIESFALIAFFSHLLYPRDLAKKSFPALISIK